MTVYLPISVATKIVHFNQLHTSSWLHASIQLTVGRVRGMRRLKKQTSVFGVPVNCFNSYSLQALSNKIH